MNRPAELPINHLSASPKASSWEAGLHLRFESEGGNCFMRTCTHKGPLSVQKPFYPEGADLAHVYPLHPPGGLVSGDRLSIKVEVAEHARLLMTTPGAGRVYRARPDRSWQTQNNYFEVGQGSSLEWLPLETIVFPDAQARLHSHFELKPGARLVAWEVCSLGLPANKAAFETGSLIQALSVDIEGKPMVRERLQIDESSRNLLNANSGFQSKPVAGLMVAGPFSPEMFKQARHTRHVPIDCEALTEADMEELRDLCKSLPANHLATVTQAGAFLLIRTLGPCSSIARQLLEDIWTCLRPKLMGRPACPPRIWRT